MISLNKLAIRYLKEQKKRTILTIIGIIVSVAMVTAIGTMMNSLNQREIQYTRERFGTNHGAFLDISSEQYDYIKNHLKIERSGISILAGTSYFLKDDILTRIELRGYDDNYLDFRNIKVEGSYPEKSNEIVLEYWIARNLNLSIGDEVVLPVGSFYVGDKVLDRSKWEDNAIFKEITKKAFKVVGLTSSDGLSQATNSSRGIVSLQWAQEIDKTGRITATFRLKDEVKREELTPTILSIARDLNIPEDKVQANRHLIHIESRQYDKTLVAIVMFLVGLVVAATVAVIFNSFNIAVVERIKQFGIMRSIGTTPKQIRKLVFIEASLLSLIAIPLGIIFGYIGTRILFYLLALDRLSNFVNLKIITSPFVVVSSAIVGIVSVYLSALFPAISAGRVAALNAIFYHRSLKQKVKKSKGGHLIKKLIGIEALLAYKNAGRNKKRLLITAFSLSISVILFVVFSLFTNYALKINETRFDYSADFILRVSGGADNNNLYPEKDVVDIRNIEGIKEVIPIRSSNVISFVESDKILFDNFPKYYTLDSLTERYTVFGGVLYGYNSTELVKTMEELVSPKVDIEAMNREMGVLIVRNVMYFDENKANIKPMFNLKVGDTIILEKSQGAYFEDPEGYYIDENNNVKLKVMGILEKITYGSPYPFIGQLELITTDKVYAEITGLRGYNTILINLEENADYLAVSSRVDAINSRTTGTFIQDNIAINSRDRKTVREISVFIYGFITLITLIGTLNIINTISTNIITRIKEFGMLRAVGMCPKSMRKMIRLEAIFSSILGALIGLIIGNILSYYLFTLMTELRGFDYEFPIRANAIAILGTISIALIASIAPLRKIAGMNIIDVLREE